MSDEQAESDLYDAIRSATWAGWNADRFIREAATLWDYVARENLKRDQDKFKEAQKA